MLTLQNPLGTKANLNGVLTPNGFQAYSTPQYLQSWNLTVEREIGKAVALELSYVGSKGTHMGRKVNINMPFRNPDLRVNGNFPRPISGFNDLDYYSFGGNSSFNSGMVTFRKRMARGFFYRLNYVYSKSIDEASQIADNSDGGGGAPQNPRCLRCERGRSDWDRGHSFTSLFLYDIPLRKNRIVRDWQVSGTTRFQTGPPYTLLVSNSQLDQGEANRPDRIAKGTVANPTPDRWYDTSAFPTVPANAFRFGNSGRNILDGPGLIDSNVSLIKRLRVAERYNFQFRAEAFNALNHPNSICPARNVNAPDAATITDMRTPRLLQLGLRLQF